MHRAVPKPFPGSRFQNVWSFGPSLRITWDMFLAAGSMYRKHALRPLWGSKIPRTELGMVEPSLCEVSMELLAGGYSQSSFLPRKRRVSELHLKPELVTSSQDCLSKGLPRHWLQRSREASENSGSALIGITLCHCIQNRTRESTSLLLYLLGK